ncbi:MAG: ribosome small subunit-dependent GTPase A [Gammaproteobacteria bacterium]|nr:ribosome small subunit-dependent GTPase A [Gammaproteobacteria bacterium]
MKNLQSIGFDKETEEHIDADKLKHHEIARVVSVHKDSYQVSDGGDDVFAELAGKLQYTITSSIDLPTTGDWVYVDFYDDNSHAIIHDVVARQSLIKRKYPGKQVDYQLIAANIDVAFIVQSLDYNFNLRRLERYLVMIHDSHVTPVILLSKSDLLADNEIATLVRRVNEIAPNVTVMPFSNQSPNDIEKIKKRLLPAKTYCLLGSSGVGKTTLLNSIVGSQIYETKAVSKIDSKGRHTTTSRQLIRLDCGAMLIDTPGMRELGNISVDSGIDETFSEIRALSLNCRFKNCTHVNEKGCAVLAAINNAELEQKRYDNYMKMMRESEYNEMSYLDKKQKAKKLGKLIKSTIKGKSGP